MNNQKYSRYLTVQIPFWGFGSNDLLDGYDDVLEMEKETLEGYNALNDENESILSKYLLNYDYAAYQDIIARQYLHGVRIYINEFLNKSELWQNATHNLNLRFKSDDCNSITMSISKKDMKLIIAALGDDYQDFLDARYYSDMNEIIEKDDTIRFFSWLFEYIEEQTGNEYIIWIMDEINKFEAYMECLPREYFDWLHSHDKSENDSK